MDGDGLWLRGRLLVAGYSDGEVRRRVRAGQLRRVRRGAYLAGPLPDSAEARHLLLVDAQRAQLADDAVVSHVSAALVHGLPAWGVPLGRVSVIRTSRRRSGGRRSASVHVHAAPLDAEEITMVGDVPVTTVERTLVDVARTVPFEQAVVIADGALARHLVDPSGLQVALRRATGWLGAPAARRALAFADPRSESVGESRSRVAIARARLPAPVPQWEVWAGGEQLGRVDFGWPESRTVGEFDGRSKYGRLLRPGQHPADAVFAEKRREDALRAENLTVVRWTWPDLNDFTPTATRLHHHLTPAR